MSEIAVVQASEAEVTIGTWQWEDFEILVPGLYGPGSEVWVPFVRIWEAEGRVNFTLVDGGWISYRADAEVQLREAT